MSNQEWLDRFERRVMEKSGSAELARGERAAVAEQPDFREGYEDDPEGSADMAMSYWDVEPL